MPRLHDLTGQIFGRLTVITRAKNTCQGKHVAWNCLCECGNKSIAEAGSLTSGTTKSCGCLKRERSSEAQTTHGLHGTPEHTSWCSMKNRCLNSTSPSFVNYGGRGITVCKEWMTFDNFYADMGPRPANHSIDRIDNNKGYFPENCRWATTSQQMHNRRMLRNNTSGITGVWWDKSKDRWIVGISVNGKAKRLYHGNDFFEACCVRKSAELSYWSHP